MLTQAAMLMLAVALVVLAHGDDAPPGDLPPTPPLRLSLDAPGTVIVAPEEGEYRAAAERLAEGIEEAVGRRPAIVPDTTAPGDLGPGPVIVPGNVMAGGLARVLYLHDYDFTDYSWPGPGGHAVRTIRDPFGGGAHVLMLSVSDAGDLPAATAALLDIIRREGPAPGYVNHVKLGRWEAETKRYTERLLGEDDRVWTRVGGAGSWDYQIQIARAGAGFLRTGDERYLEAFAREMRYFFDHYVLTLRTDAPPQTHGFLHTMLRVWDLIRDHPAFSEEQRAKFDADFLHVYRSSEGPGRLERAVTRTVIRDNHGTRTALDAFFGGRYFARRFGLPEADRWLELAEGYFAAQMGSAKPVEDSWGHQWAASLYNTLVYALAADRAEYLASDALREAADRALIAHSRAGAPRSYMSACAVATGDTGYLSGHTEGEAYGRQGAAMRGQCDEYLRAFCTDEPIRAREDLLGLSVAPLDELWYETIDTAGFNPGGLFVVTTPREEGFDKASIREGWGHDDFYLLLDGISGGHHSYQDGNCIIVLQEDGVTWSSRTSRDLSESGTVRSSNGVAVALDGAGPGRLHRYARLLYGGEADRHTAVASALDGVGEADWQRHIVRRRGEWTLVVDRVVVRRAGEVLAERHWHMRGDVTPQADGIISSQNIGGRHRYLHLQSVGVSPGGMRGTGDRAELVRAAATPDEPLEFATLLHTTREAAVPPGWRRIRALDAACDGDPPAPDGIGRLEGLDIVVLRAEAPGAWLEMAFNLDRDVTGEVFAELLDYTDRGDVRILLDGAVVVERHEHHARTAVRRPAALGRHELRAGEHRLRLEVVGKSHDGEKHYVGLGGLLIAPEGAPGADLAQGPDEREFRLSRTPAGWRVEGGQGAAIVTVGEEGVAVATAEGRDVIGVAPTKAAPAQALLPLRPDCARLALPWREMRVAEAPVTAVAVAEDGRLAAGDEAGRVAVFGPDGATTATTRCESGVLALHFVGDDLLVGEDRGALTRLGPDGARRWEVAIPYIPMPWDYWTDGRRSRVREIASADITGDGAPEILVANSDRRVYAFGGDGRELWKSPAEWGVFTAMTPGRFRGDFGLLGGTSRPSIHGRCLVYGADGGLRATLTRPDLVSWSVPSQFRDMRLADVDGDGEAEIITAVDTNCRQLVVYRQEGPVLWDADMAGSAEAVAVAAGEPPTVYCGGVAGYVAAFEGAGGERLWARFLGEGIALLTVLADGTVAAAAPSGNVYLLSPAGEVRGCAEVGSEVTTVLRPGDHRSAAVVLVGTGDGRLVAYP